MQHPLIIERPDLQSAGQRRLFSILSLAAWALWLYLLAPLASLAAWALGVRHFYVEMLLPKNDDYLRELVLYSAVLLLALTVVMMWSQYNLRRFGGIDRRTMPAAVTISDEMQHYRLSFDTIAEAKHARIVVVAYGAQQEIASVDFPELPAEVDAPVLLRERGSPAVAGRKVAG